jgi:hypothetical protein
MCSPRTPAEGWRRDPFIELEALDVEFVTVLENRNHHWLGQDVQIRTVTACVSPVVHDPLPIVKFVLTIG